MIMIIIILMITIIIIITIVIIIRRDHSMTAVGFSFLLAPIA